MFKLIHADFYKTFHRAAYYMMLLIFCGLAFLFSLMLRGSSAGTWSGSVGVAVELLFYPPMLLPMITQIVLGEEYREHNMKNTLSFGTDRGLLFSTKWVSSVLLGLILTAAVFGVYFGSSAMLLQHDSAFSQELMRQFLSRLGVACLIYIASVTMSLFFLVLFNRNTLAIFLYYGVFYLTDLLLTLFHLKKVVPYLLKSQLSSIVGEPNVLMQQPILVSLATMAVFFVASLAVSYRKDFT